MFTDEELELIEELVTNHGGDWATTRIEQALVDSILVKIDGLLNG